MISVVIVLVAIILFSVIISNKKIFKKGMALRLPLLVGTFYLVISIPVILKLSDNIHSIYGMFYGLLNLPVIYLFGDTGVIDNIEEILFAEKSIYTSNMILIGIGLIFWLIISSVIGILIDKQR